MRLLYFFLISFALFIATLMGFCSKNELLNEIPRTKQITNKAISSEPTTKAIIPTKGKELFRSNCASCHNKNMQDKLVGPALSGTRERWAGREDLLREWIRNSSKLIASRDPYALQLYEEWNKAPMTAFPNLSDEDIEEILDYIEIAGK